MLLLSAITVYIYNVRGVLDYLPLHHAASGSSASFGVPQTEALEALQSIAASHLIIAVSLERFKAMSLV